MTTAKPIIAVAQMNGDKLQLSHRTEDWDVKFDDVHFAIIADSQNPAASAPGSLSRYAAFCEGGELEPILYYCKPIGFNTNDVKRLLGFCSTEARALRYIDKMCALKGNGPFCDFQIIKLGYVCRLRTV